ncbi:hypothetical protein LK994_12905 [Ferruginibacter lapsinanis]|uniref:hypothetical protein n=1 Tax=Ferruginibacter lapsinanis TaxID=563172 RepID=UPI001E52D333|nr:hypothetical protein [Ferruginibacter lapsinanis]UEG49533.1 hypothetical protein LK994_12905 [Ferruginibacter lapsinanis]
MKKIFSGLLLCFLLQHTVSAQTKQQAQRDFVKELNAVLKASSTIHWAYTDRMTIDSAFAISKNDILSVTVRYTNDSSFFRFRMEVPMNKIRNIIQDVYLVLECDQDAVKCFLSEKNSNTLVFSHNYNLFHTGELMDADYETLERIKKIFDKIRRT